MNNSPQSSVSQYTPTHEQVATRAELLWKAKGTPNGQDEEIWFEAEKQLFDEARETIGTSTASTQITSSTPKAVPPKIPASVASEQMTLPVNPKRTPGKKRASGK